LALLAVATLILAAIDRRSWFFGDEWDFIAQRGLHHPAIGLFVPHNEHWVTTPILIYRALFTVFGLHTYVPYIGVVLVLHAAVAHVLWRIMRRSGVRPWLASLLAFAFVLNGAGVEQVTYAFQVTFVAPVLLGLCHLLLCDHEGRWDRRDVLGVALTVWGLTFSGIGVPMIAIAGLAVLIRRGWPSALVTVIPGATVYLLWFGLVGHTGLAPHQITGRSLLQVPEYAWKGLTAAVDNSLPFPGVGAVVLVGLALYLILRSERGRSGGDVPAIAAACGAVILFLVVGPGRVGLGVEQGESSRYSYIAWCLLLPAFALVVEEFIGSHRFRSGVVVGVIGLGLLRSADALLSFSDNLGRTEQALRRRFLAVAELADSGATVLAARPDTTHSPNLTVADLVRMRRAGQLQSFDPTLVDRLKAEGAVQVRLGPAPVPAGSRQPRITVIGAAIQPAGAGCMRVGPSIGNPRVEVSPGHSALELNLINGGDLRVFVRGPGDLIVDPGQSRTLMASAPTSVEFAFDDGAPVLILPPGEAVICGLAP
jgi:hypothetical protein